MNKERLQELADHIRTTKHTRDGTGQRKDRSCFHLAYFQFDCGAPMCIAGHCMYMHGKDVPRKFLNERDLLSETNLAYVARIFDLSYHLIEELCAPSCGDIEYDAVTPKIAADVIERLIATNEVKWPVEVRKYEAAIE